MSEYVIISNITHLNLDTPDVFSPHFQHALTQRGISSADRPTSVSHPLIMATNSSSPSPRRVDISFARVSRQIWRRGGAHAQGTRALPSGSCGRSACMDEAVMFLQCSLRRVHVAEYVTMDSHHGGRGPLSQLSAQQQLLSEAQGSRVQPTPCQPSPSTLCWCGACIR